MRFGNIVFIALSPVSRQSNGSVSVVYHYENGIAGILFVRKNIFHRSKLYPIFLGKLLCAHAIQIVRKMPRTISAFSLSITNLPFSRIYPNGTALGT